LKEITGRWLDDQAAVLTEIAFEAIGDVESERVKWLRRANRLLRLQLDLIQALDRHRRGHKQTVEVRQLHLHSGAQGVVGIVNAREREGDGEK